MHALLRRHRIAIAALCRRYRVQTLSVVGSATRGWISIPSGAMSTFWWSTSHRSNLDSLTATSGWWWPWRHFWTAMFIWWNGPLSGTPASGRRWRRMPSLSMRCPSPPHDTGSPGLPQGRGGTDRPD